MIQLQTMSKPTQPPLAVANDTVAKTHMMEWQQTGGFVWPDCGDTFCGKKVQKETGTSNWVDEKTGQPIEVVEHVQDLTCEECKQNPEILKTISNVPRK